MMAILNHEIHSGVNCFRTIQMSEQDQEKWWRGREDGRHPAWVATIEGDVVGWSSITRWSAYEAYDATVEISIWIRPDAQRRGIGRSLFQTTIDYARQANFRVILSRIESENTASLKLHEKFGFQTVGHLHRVGEKFGRLLDVLILEYQLS